MTLSIIALSFATFFGFGNTENSALKNLHIQKQISIKGSPEEVFDMVRYLNNFPKWSPFLAEDPSQKYEVKGTDGEIGAQYHWEGNEGKDLGFQEIVKLNPPHFVGMRCDIQKPFTATPTFDYTFTQSGDEVIVTQDFNLKTSKMDSFFMWLFGAKKGMEETNQKGLELLKAAVEK